MEELYLVGDYCTNICVLYTHGDALPIWVTGCTPLGRGFALMSRATTCPQGGQLRYLGCTIFKD